LTGPLPEFALAAAGGLLVGLAYTRWRVARRAARSRALGTRAELRARKLLRAAGYRIVDEQPTARVRVVVDGTIEEFPVRGDLLVRRRRKLYLAEIKGGPEVASVAHRGTRRQLLEYATAFPVDGVLLVDMHRGEVRRVTFPGRPRGRA